ncbi:hypothetical protein QVD17_11247 [Tagetes erecta]|uniref:HHO5-like N-terminal domain-containing protein n=1 Tax=Tagetes erecta TaxID=13708 RepID=A0AAD8P0N6_TARER|nr:hypothetical protein QVD17_11247 [Tagetes erecta]
MKPTTTNHPQPPPPPSPDLTNYCLLLFILLSLFSFALTLSLFTTQTTITATPTTVKHPLHTPIFNALLPMPEPPQTQQTYLACPFLNSPPSPPSAACNLLRRLELERKKIQVFERELPLCLELVNQGMFDED